MVAQRGSGGHIPGNIQGQVERGSDQPDLVEDVTDYCRGLGLMTSKYLSQPKALYDSMIL